MPTFGSRKMDNAVTFCASLTSLIVAAAGHLWWALIFMLLALTPWLRVVHVSLLAEHRVKMEELRKHHEERVEKLEAEIKRLKHGAR